MPNSNWFFFKNKALPASVTSVVSVGAAAVPFFALDPTGTVSAAVALGAALFNGVINTASSRSEKPEKMDQGTKQLQRIGDQLRHLNNLIYILIWAAVIYLGGQAFLSLYKILSEPNLFWGLVVLCIFFVFYTQFLDTPSDTPSDMNQ